MAGLLEAFEARFGDDGMLWLLLAGGFPNISALPLYTSFGFLVTSLDSDKTPNLQRQVLDADIRVRLIQVLGNTLTLRHYAAAADAGVAAAPDAAALADAGNMQAHIYNLRRRARRRRVRRRGGVGPRPLQRRAAARWPPGAKRALRFCTIKEQFTLLTGPLVLRPQTVGALEQEMMEYLWSMSERASLDPSSQSFLIHLNVAKQCHLIASTRRLHVSNWIAEQKRENRENEEWNRRFSASLANDVMLLWKVFRMPCLALLQIGYASACCPGGLRDIVRSGEERIKRGKPLPAPIINPQKELHK